MTAMAILGALCTGFLAACITRKWFVATVCFALICGLVATLAARLHS